MNAQQILALAADLDRLTEQAVVDQLAKSVEAPQENSDRLAALAQILSERQKILARLQKADTSRMDEPTRRALSQTVARVRRADAEMVETLRSRSKAAQKQLDTTARARGAIRAYRPGDGERPRTRGRSV